MATQLQIRRGTSSQVAAFTGAEGEVVVNTTNDSIHVNDGSTAGGFELARVDGSNWAITNAISTTANISFGDNDKAIFGSATDLAIYSDGTNAYIQEGAGTSGIRITTDNQLLIRKHDTENIAAFNVDGAVRFYHDNAQVFSTNSTGIEITGEVEADTAHFGTGTGTGAGVADEVVVSGTGSTGLTIHSPDASNATLGFGSASDNDYAFVQGFYNSGSPFLRFSIQNSEKAKVTSTGIDVTGTVTATAGAFESTGATEITLEDTDGGFAASKINVQNGGRDLKVTAPQDIILNVGSSDAVTILNGGNVGIGVSSPDSLLHGEAVGGGANFQVLSRAFFGSLYSNHFAVIGSAVKADTGANTRMLATETSTGAGRPSAIQFGDGNIDFHTIASSTANAAFDNLRMRITSGGDVEIKSGGKLQANRADNARNIQLFNDNDFGTIQTSNDPIKIASQAYTRFDVSGSELLRITSGGQVGIGTSSPSKKLSIKADGGGSQLGIDIHNEGTATGDDAVISFETQGSREFTMGLDRSATSFVIAESSTLGSNQRLVIDDSGQVGIGHSSPGTQLDVDGGIRSKVSSGSAILYLNNGTTQHSIQNDSNALVFYENAAEAMRIDSSGNLIVGGTTAQGASAVTLTAGGSIITDGFVKPHTDASYDLGASSQRWRYLYLSSIAYIAGTTGRGLKISNATESYTNNVAVLDAQHSQGILQFKTAGSEAARIDKDGNFLVGKTVIGATSAGFAVVNDEYISSTNTATASGSRVLLLNRQSGTGTSIEFRQANTSVGSVSVTASATAYNTSSDQRLKENIVDAPSASDDIDAIQVRSFDWKADGSHQKYGMVAQELQGVAPEAVTGDADSDEMMGVDYSKLVPMLVKEIQSLRARVQQLENN
jgi:hypothetical protein